MNNLIAAPGAPQDGPQQPQAQMPAPEDIASARAHGNVVLAGLMKLASAPKGSLSKQSVYDAAADMIGQGAFSTPQAKQQLVASLAQMPDDEPSLRKAIGGFILQLSHAHDMMQQHFGPGE